MIQFFHVHKNYRNQPALVDLSLDVGKGEFVFLTGPSGAGKTTLLKLIFCAERAQRGQILVSGRNITRIRDSAIPYLRRNIGVVFQDFKLLPNATVAENIGVTLEVLALPRPEIQRRVLAILKAVGLEHKAEALPPRLSGGEQQRVAIARALVNDPAILLADEPTGNLDADMTVDILTLLSDANARGTTVVVATHDQHLLDSQQRRTLLLSEGRILERRWPPRDSRT
jgi:cell division transport system ATP-binding protein